MRARTISEVRGMSARLERALRALDLMPKYAVLVLSEGSKYYGIAYRVNYQFTRECGPTGKPNEDSWSAHYDFAFDSYLGMTKREAYEALAMRASTLEAVLYAQEKAQRLAGGAG